MSQKANDDAPDRTPPADEPTTIIRRNGPLAALQVPPPASSPRALVLDDDAPVGRAIGRILQREGFESHVTTSALDAVRELERGERFDLVVSDVQMPEIDGTAFFEAAQLCWPEIATVLVFVTGGALATPRGIRCFEKPLRADFVEHARRVASAVGEGRRTTR